jgi:TPR repeat protein
MYYRGQGVPRGFREAAQWFTQAAEQGNAKAQFNMGVTYYDGQGVLQDYVEAYKWALLASMNGSAQAGVLGDTLRRIMTPSQLEEAQRRAKALLDR